MWTFDRVKSWIGRQLGLTGGINLRLLWPDNWFQLGRDAPGAGIGALTFPAVYGCIDLISGDIARLPLRHWRDDGETKTEVRDSWPCGVLDKPNDYQTGFDLMKMLIASQLYRGNGYLFPFRNRRFQIDELHCLFPDNVWVYRVPGTAEYFYQVTNEPNAGIVNERRMVPPREMLHHRMLVFNDPLIGITPMLAAATSASAGLAILRNSERFFAKMSRPSGVLQTAKALDQRKAEAIKERWQKIYAGEEGMGDVAVLEEGLEWKPLTMTAVDAQLIEQLRYSVQDVASVYHVPLFMLGDPSKASTGSAEELARNYFGQCLSAHMKSLEWRLSQFFGLDGRSEYLAFDLEELFRTDFRTRTEALARSVQGGIRTPNEARRLEGLDPVAGGDTPFMQSQMVPVSQLAGRTDLTPKVGMTPVPAQTPTRAAPEALGWPEDADPYSDTPDADSPIRRAPERLTEALMSAVFDAAPLRPRTRYADSVLAYRHQQQRKLIYGRSESVH